MIYKIKGMKRKILSAGILFIGIVYSEKLFSQDSIIPFKAKVAIFAPLYLDSAFDAMNNYRYGANFPRFMDAGIEFYEGVRLALDSLNNEGRAVEVFVFDTKAAKTKLATQLEKAKNDSVDLIIAFSETARELQQFASSAQMMRAPFINVNLPNDGGVYSNPYFVVLNSTLKTHVESIYQYVQKYYAIDNIVVFRKKGQLEDMIQSYFDEAEKNTASVPLKINYVMLADTILAEQLTPYLDSNRKTLCIVGSLDESFGKKLCLQVAALSKDFSVSLVGMPTFDNMDKEFSKTEFKGLEIIYGTPFYNPRSDTVSKKIINYFNAKMFARPSDLVMRGYEATWRFVNLLLSYKKDLASNLTRKQFDVFREFNIQPVVNKQTMTLDYYENKKIFFIKWLDGIIKGVN